MEKASSALSTIETIEMAIANVDGLCGQGVSYVSGKKNGRHSDPTYQAFQSLYELRGQLNEKRGEALVACDSAAKELKAVPNKDMRKILYLRHLKHLKWHDIAEIFGAGYSADMIKQRYSRFRHGLQRDADSGEMGCAYGA